MQPREFLRIILQKCPSYQLPLPDCALVHLRRGKDEAACSLLLAEMSEEEVDETIRKHFLCVCRKNGCGT